MRKKDSAEWVECVGPGWRDIVRKTIESLSEGAKVVQVKEKFGGLRLYYRDGNEQDRRLVDAAEYSCWFVCEECGTALDVETKGPRWIKTLCAGCREGLRNE